MGDFSDRSVAPLAIRQVAVGHWRARMTTILFSRGDPLGEKRQDDKTKSRSGFSKVERDVIARGIFTSVFAKGLELAFEPSKSVALTPVDVPVVLVAAANLAEAAGAVRIFTKRATPYQFTPWVG
jgi:hypothetical protein